MCLHPVVHLLHYLLEQTDNFHTIVRIWNLSSSSLPKDWSYKSFLILETLKRIPQLSLCINRHISAVEFLNSTSPNKINRFNCFKRMHNFHLLSYVIWPRRESLLKSMVLANRGLQNALSQCDRNFWSLLAIGAEDVQITKSKIIPNLWEQCRDMTLTLISHLLIIYVLLLVSFQLNLQNY